MVQAHYTFYQEFLFLKCISLPPQIAYEYSKTFDKNIEGNKKYLSFTVWKDVNVDILV